MKPLRLLTAILCIASCNRAFAQVQDIDKELSDLTERLAGPIKDHGKTKVAVIDFANLDGSSAGELGKYIAEQLTVDFVMGKRDFSVLDRANLRNILAEHKLTSKGLVDPDNAKKLGQFAGVDALILGTVIPKGTHTVSLTAKIITTDTAEVIGAARAEFTADATVRDLMSKPVAESNAGGASGLLQDDKPQAGKTFGDLRVELQSLRIVNGKEYLLTMTVANQSKRTVWVAVNHDTRAQLTDAQGSQFLVEDNAAGIPLGTPLVYMWQAPLRFSPATELAPNNSATGTLKFFSPEGKAPNAGACTVQIEFLLGREFGNNSAGNASKPNLVTQIEAN
jgi:TolB-like protein